jgi:hypothetical protein
MACGYEILGRRGDGIKRWWFGSSPRLKNIDQCPRCRGTDKAHEHGPEGWCCQDYKCDRCDIVWGG